MSPNRKLELKTKECKLCHTVKLRHKYFYSYTSPNNGKRYWMSYCKECDKDRRWRKHVP